MAEITGFGLSRRGAPRLRRRRVYSQGGVGSFPDKRTSADASCTSSTIQRSFGSWRNTRRPRHVSSSAARVASAEEVSPDAATACTYLPPSSRRPRLSEQRFKRWPRSGPESDLFCAAVSRQDHRADATLPAPSQAEPYACSWLESKQPTARSTPLLTSPRKEAERLSRAGCAACRRARTWKDLFDSVDERKGVMASRKRSLPARGSQASRVQGLEEGSKSVRMNEQMLAPLRVLAKPSCRPE